MRRSMFKNKIVQPDREEEKPIDRDYEIAVVLNIIKQAIEKLKISLILPKILQNPTKLKTVLKGTGYEKCAELVMEYVEEENTVCDFDNSQPSYRLLNLIDYLHDNHKILEVLKVWLDKISDKEKKILKSFMELYELAEERFMKEARPELAKEKHIHEAYTGVIQLEKDIQVLLSKLEARKSYNMWKMAATTGYIKSLEDECEYRQRDNHMLLKEKIDQSKKEIHQHHQHFLSQQKELELEQENLHLNYENALKENLKKEREVKIDRNKFLIQLGLLKEKYDQTVAQKQLEELSCDQEYKDLKAQYDEFMIEYNRELEVYNQVTGEWEKERQQRILEFAQNFAARRVQRFWRKYIIKKRKLNRQLAKKAKKTAGKTKETAGKAKKK